MLLGFFLSCSDYTLKYQDSDPKIKVSYETNYFGRASVLNEEETYRSFEVKNIGGRILNIDRIYTVDENSFNTENEFENIFLNRNESYNFDIVFSPEIYGDSSSYIIIESNDPENEELSIDIYGWGTAPKISITPEDHNFGEIEIGCKSISVVSIKNIGDDVLSVEDIILSSNDELKIDLLNQINGDFPWLINPDNLTGVIVKYEPSEDGANISFLNVLSNDPEDPIVESRHIADGFVSEYKNETFIVEEESLLDIMFVIDDSGSMNDNQSTMQSNANDLLLHMEANNIDYNIGIITTSSYSLEGSIISVNHPNRFSEFESQVMVGISGSGNEKGMEMLYRFFNSSNSLQNFPREDANLALIFITDEDDSSPSSINSYFTFFKGLKQNPDKVKIHSVVGIPSVSNCASSAIKLINITNMSGGVSSDICELDWSSGLEDIVNLSAIPTDIFYLSETPVENTIKVYLNGVDIGNNYFYNSSDNSIKINNNIVLSKNDRVSIDYGLYGCD